MLSFPSKKSSLGQQYYFVLGSYVLTWFDNPPQKEIPQSARVFCVVSSGRLANSPKGLGRISAGRKGIDRAIYR